MPNYFDYISESAQACADDIDTCDDVDNLFNEMDLAMCEFDSYVQEGVGLKIVIGIAATAALAGLIALIIKLFRNKSTSIARNKTKAAKKKAEEIKKKRGGDTTVKRKKKRNSGNNGNKSNHMADSFVMEPSLDQMFQETSEYKANVSYLKGGDAITMEYKKRIEAEFKFVDELINIFCEGLEKNIPGDSLLSSIQQRAFKGLGESVKADAKIELILQEEQTVTVDDIIYECIHIENLIWQISHSCEDLATAKKKLDSCKRTFERDNALGHHMSRESTALYEKMENRIIAPAINKLQSKLIKLNEEIIRLMNSNIAELDRIAMDSDDFVDTVRASSRSVELADHTKLAQKRVDKLSNS